MEYILPRKREEMRQFRKQRVRIRAEGNPGAVIVCNVPFIVSPDAS